jgi:glutamine synthetase
VHRLSEIDPVARLAVCSECGPVKVKTMGFRKDGSRRWRCRTSKLAGEPEARRRHSLKGIAKMRQDRGKRRDMGEVCERCGFEPVVARQLEVHHRDGDRANDAADNRVTLCANCHRLAHRHGNRAPPVF